MTAPQRTRIKFCGMTRAADLALAADLGVDAVGLIFAARSPRCLEPAVARELRAGLSPQVTVVALLMDPEPSLAAAVIEQVRPTWLQFHGSESPQECAMHGLPYLKAVPMARPEDAPRYVARYPDAAGFVFDAHAAGESGGSGRRFDWGRLPRGLTRPLWLAGGLTPDNVFDAVRAVRPWAVDVSSGIEAAPGIKDGELMRRFVDEVRRADQSQ